MLALFCCLAAHGASISSYSPAFGQPGNVISITGSGLNSVTSVAFNSVSPTLGDFTNVSDSQLLVVVPLGAISGPLEVFVGATGSSSSSSFQVAPVITGFNPQSGTNPAMVYIQGANFVSGGTSVIFPGVSAPVNASYVASTEVGATVPVGAGNGPLTVYTSAGTNVSASNFMAGSLPTIASFSPTAGAIGTPVTIVGGNFFSGTTVRFGSVSAVAPTIVSTAQITAAVPSGAVTAPITVANSFGSVTTSSNFLTGSGPVVTGFSPAMGAMNTYVTINGLNLLSVTNVTVNGSGERLVSTSDSSIQISLTNNPGSGPIKVTASGVSFTTSTNFTNSSAPFVTDFNPVLGQVGSTVTIDGLNFLSVTSVKFGSTGVSPSITSGTQISATVPSISTGSYAITVQSPSGSYTTSSNFTITAAGPVITSFTPTNGVRGANVTLSGANFTNVNSVKFNGVTATFQTPTSLSQLIVTVPANATSGLIAVANTSGTGNSPSIFYMQQWITSLSTNAGIVNMNITLSGRNLTNTGSVQIDGIPYPFTSAPSQITVTVPSNATTGRIEITSPGGIFISTNNFVILPKIYGFSPNIGPAGTMVTISGTSLFNVTNVKFGGVSAGVSGANTNQAQAIVPANAASGPLSVFTPDGNDTSTNSFTATKPSAVQLTKTVSPLIAVPGTDVTYTLAVTNDGPSIITSTVVTDTMPANLIFVSATASMGSWVYTNNLVIWDLGILTNNNAASLQIVGTYPAAIALVNNAALSFAEGNMAPYSNTAAVGNLFLSNSQRTLSVTRQLSPPGVLVSWPASPATFGLQINTNSNLDAGWMSAPYAVFLSNSANTYTDSIALPQTFYRLTLP